MKLKNSFPLLSATCMLFSLVIVGCTQNPSAPKTENPIAEMKTEDKGRLITIQREPDTLKGSLKAEVSGKIGNATVKINYHSPAVRGRGVWGGLVPYNQVWVTGAHKATSLSTDQELNFGGKKIAAGTYALFTIPGKTEWTIILNTNWQQHLADDYNDKEDLLRISVKPEIQQENQERLRYEVVSGAANTGQIVITWEKLKLVVPVSSE